MTAKTESSNQNMFLRVIKHIWDEYSIIIVTVVIFSVAGFFAPRFLTFPNMMVVLRHSALIGIMALGMTFVIISGGIDLSAGHVSAAAGTILIILQRNEAIPLPLAIAACFAMSTGLGFINGVIITKFRLPAFIVTLAIGLMARSVALNATGGVSIVGRRVPEFTNIGSGTIGPFPNALVVWIILAIILGGILAYTRFGSYIYAVGSNETAAKYTGISVDRIRIAAYTLTGFCVGLASLLNYSRMAAIAPSTSAYLYEFDAITAVVVGGVALSGGRGKILGTFFGMIIIGVVTNLMIQFRVSPYLMGFIKGAIILTAIMLQRRDQA